MELFDIQQPINKESNDTTSQNSYTPRLTCAYNKYRQWVSIEDVESGLACECTCPDCGEQLEARKGNVYQHHFAHYNPERQSPEEKARSQKKEKECYNNTLHKLAEYIVEQEKCIMLPSYGNRYGKIDSKKVHLENIKVEQGIEQNSLRPDIIATQDNGILLLIEIRNTHPVDPEKIEKIKSSGYTALEIDISKQKMDRNSLKDFLLNSDKNRKWLNNPEYDRILDEKRKKKEEEQRIEEEKRKKELDIIRKEVERQRREEEIRKREEEERIEEEKREIERQRKEKAKELQRIQREEERRKREEENNAQKQQSDYSDWKDIGFCLCPKEDTTIDSYYSNVKRNMNKTFYKDENKESVIVNWQRNGDMFHVVHVIKAQLRFYFTIVYWNGERLIHNTSTTGYFNDYIAMLSGNKKIGLE